MTQRRLKIEGIATSGAMNAHNQRHVVEGLTWQLPMPLMLEHGTIPIGLVTRVWSAEGKIRFNAEIEKEDVQERVKSGELRCASINLDGQRTDGDTEGDDFRVLEGRITEISLCREGANPDAIIEISTRKPIKIAGGAAPPSPPPDPSADELRTIRARLRDIDKHKAQALADRQLQGRDNVKWMAAEKVLKKLEDECERLTQREMEIVAGIAPEPERPTRRQRAWDFEKDLPEPIYPRGARVTGDTAALDAGRAAFSDFFGNYAKSVGSNLGLAPNAPMPAELGMMFFGEAEAAEAWLSRRVAEAEERIAALEVRQQRFCGVHQRALAYSKGSLVTHGGSLWAAVADVPEGATPGNSDHWQLACKKGTFDD